MKLSSLQTIQRMVSAQGSTHVCVIATHRPYGPFETSFLILNRRQLLGICLGDANQCQRVLAKLEAGTVWVNQYGILYNNVRSSSHIGLRFNLT